MPSSSEGDFWMESEHEIAHSYQARQQSPKIHFLGSEDHAVEGWFCTCMKKVSLVSWFCCEME